MAKGPRIRGIQFFPASPELNATGLIAWASFQCGGLQFHDVGLRRTVQGRLVLSWPRIVSRGGLERCVVHPVNDVMRLSLEGPVVAEALRKGLA